MKRIGLKVMCHPQRSFKVFAPPKEDLCPTLRATDYKCPIIAIEVYDSDTDTPEER